MAAPAHVDLGYSFATTAPAAHRLEVWIREHPTERHFDPESAQYSVAADDGRVDTLEVQHPPLALGDYRVCAGRVILTDRKGKVVEVFTFGGVLTITSEAAVTVCRLDSAAPLLQIDDDFSSPIELLIEDIEVLLAERRAAHLSAPDEYERRLTALEPFDLYAACIFTVADLLQRRHASPEQREARLLHHLRAEIERLTEAGLWPSLPSRLDEIL